MRLQSILLPQKEICPISDLYYHKYVEGQIDFDGYFNLFQIKKHKKYTDITGLKLYLSAPGFKKIALMHDREEVAVYEKAESGQNLNMDNGGSKENHTALSSGSRAFGVFNFPYADYDEGVFWFRLYYDEKSNIDPEHLEVRGFMGGEIATARDVNIVVDICTFRREPYVYRNMKSLMTMIEDAKKAKLEGDTLGCKEVSDHLKVFLVDNGQTLSQHQDMTELVKKSDGIISIFPNKNYGGAAGFTRGMLEALNHKEEYGITHVLLMDDDAVFDPDVFVRAYGFMATVKEEYRDLRLGGTLLREDYQNIIHACGESYGDFKVINKNLITDISKYENCITPGILSTDNENTDYSGWWCCCYPIQLIERNKLPIPLFIHSDDMNFELQFLDTGTVFLNGVGVWHKGFELTFIGTNAYYDTRNLLITAVLGDSTGKVTKSYVKKKILRLLTVYIFSYQYAAVKLIYKGLLDFLKGPEWLYTQNAEELNNRLRAEYAEDFPLRPMDELELPEETLAEIKKYKKNYGIDEIEYVYRPNAKYKKKKYIFNFLTLNGWILPANKDMVPHTCTEKLFEIFRSKRVVFYELANDKAAVVNKDYRELWNYFMILIKANKAIDDRFDKAKESYRQDLVKYTTKESWKKYLGI
ncbi:glycosyltransferase family 2 protein [Oribacterium sp. FC2011]|uniref:glycosyltransferase family 2 protein n=1 Tax=Oribacterium sp. FC2011 TaxID=1408311 RepID=UPI0004E1CF6C|nr:glycosyltransferase [Oribacterium sp. FC2011]